MRLAPIVPLIALTSIASAGSSTQTESIDYTASYRSQTLGVDAVAAGLALVGVLANENQSHALGNSMLGLALTTYLVGGPMIHLLHGRISHGAGSLALRVGAPLVLGLIGAAVGGPCGSDRCDEPPAVKAAAFGAVLGVIAAPILDAVLLANGDPLPASTHLTTTAVRGGGMTLSLAGSF